jgi:hypothetical protein
MSNSDATTAVAYYAAAAAVNHTAAATAATVNHTATAAVDDPPCVLGMDPDHETLIQKTMHDDWGIDHPHELQIHAIHQAAFHRNELLYIIAKTGSGKSAIPLTVSTLLTASEVALCPLLP